MQGHSSDEIERVEETIEEAHECEDSRSHDFDNELTARLEAAFAALEAGERSSHELAIIVEEYSVLDLALASLRFSQAEREILFAEIGRLADRVEFIINVDSPTRSYIFRDLDNEEILELIQAMPADEAVWVMEDLVVPRYRAIMEKLDPKKAAAINVLAKFDPDSAGRLMTGEFFAFQYDTTIGQASNYIRDHPSIDLLRRVFVQDEQGVLQGAIPLRNLVINPPSFPLKRVMRPIAHWVHPDTQRDEVIEIFERYKLADLPVLDRHGKLVGVITYEDIAEAIGDQTDETLSAIAGTQNLALNDPIWKSFLARAPWLVVTLFAGFVNATNISMFHVTPQVMMFVPLVMGLSGNIGIQCSMLMIRSMALGLIAGSRTRKILAKEVATSVITGMVFGLVSGLFVYTLSEAGWILQSYEGRHHLAIIVSLGQMGAGLIAGVIGVFSPILFHRYGIDPAVASGPITQAISDVMSAVVYFLIAASIASLLALF